MDETHASKAIVSAVIIFTFIKYYLCVRYVRKIIGNFQASL